MTSFFTHMGIGIIIAELLLRFMDDDPELRKEKRFKFWFIGLIGGLAPDLDVIPTLFLNVHSYTYHHYFTHTFLALFLLFLLVVITKVNPFMLVFFLAYMAHFWTDFIDNSVSPLGPFDILILGQPWEWGLLSGWGPMPCVNGVCGWASDYWLYPQYATHDLWTIFMNNGWGIPVTFGSTEEFLTYYDIAISIVSIPLILATFLIPIKRKISRK